MQIGHISAWIAVDGVQLEQHNVETSADGKTITCWIASEENKKFSVNWTHSLASRPTAISGYVFVDGVDCGGNTLRATSATLRVVTKSEVYTSTTTSRPFVFSVLELTDDDNYLSSSASTSIGEISLKLWRTILGKPAVSSGTKIPEDQKVHERSKKAFSHCIKFGETKQLSKAVESLSVEHLDREPFATFIFKYRSLDVLCAHGIVPIQEANQVGDKRKASVPPEGHLKDEGASGSGVLEDRLNSSHAKRAKTEKSVKLEKAQVENDNSKSLVKVEIIDLTQKRRDRENIKRENKTWGRA